MDADVTIREAFPRDHPGIRTVILQAFEHFGGGVEEANLVEALREHQHASCERVAILASQIVGHILFSPITVERAPQSFRGIGLAPLSVSPPFQRKGIGTQLIHESLDSCRRGGYDAVVVLGHTSYYPRFGFVRADNLGLSNEYEAGEAFMVLELHEGGLRQVSGLVRYGSEFGTLS